MYFPLTYSLPPEVFPGTVEIEDFFEVSGLPAEGRYQEARNKRLEARSDNPKGLYFELPRIKFEIKSSMCQLHRTAVIRHLSAAADLTHPNHESTIITSPDSQSPPEHQAALQKPDQKPHLITFRP